MGWQAAAEVACLGGEEEYNLLGVKVSDLKRFKKVIFLMENKVHLTKEGYAQFKAIKDGMYKE